MNIPLSEHFNNKKLMQFVLPSIIMMMFTSIYSVVDGFFILNCVGAIGFILTPKIAVKLGAEGEILDGCIIYGRILLVTMTVFMLQNCFQSFFVVAEKAK